MKKMQFQKYAYSEASKLFLDLFMKSDVRKYSSEAKGDRQKIKYEPACAGNLAIYFFKTGTIQIYQRGDVDRRKENAYYEWQPNSDYEDVVAAIIKDLTVFINRLNDGADELSCYWGHDGFYDFAYETSKHRTAFPEPGEE